MAKYKPGTIDDEDAVKRRLQSIEKKADEANRPSGSNAYGTTGKLQDFSYESLSNATQTEDGLMSASDKKKLDGIAQGANKTTVDSAVTESGANPVSAAAIASYVAAEVASISFVGMIVFSTSPVLPHEAGSPGKWKLKTRAFIPMTDDTLYYVYERIE